MKTRMLPVAAALLCAVLSSCGPDLGSPEACAKSYQAAVLDQQVADGDDELLRWKWRLDCMEAGLAWLADKADEEKQLKKERARYDFVRSNLSTMKKYEMEIVRVTEVKDGKRVELRIKRKNMAPKGDSETEFELKDEDRKVSHICTQIEGKWKIKGRG